MTISVSSATQLSFLAHMGSTSKSSDASQSLRVITRRGRGLSVAQPQYAAPETAEPENPGSHLEEDRHSETRPSEEEEEEEEEEEQDAPSPDPSAEKARLNAQIRRSIEKDEVQALRDELETLKRAAADRSKRARSQSPPEEEGIASPPPYQFRSQNPAPRPSSSQRADREEDSDKEKEEDEVEEYKEGEATALPTLTSNVILEPDTWLAQVLENGVFDHTLSKGELRDASKSIPNVAALNDIKINWGKSTVETFIDCEATLKPDAATQNAIKDMRRSPVTSRIQSLKHLAVAYLLSQKTAAATNPERAAYHAAETHRALGSALQLAMHGISSEFADLRFETFAKSGASEVTQKYARDEIRMGPSMEPFPLRRRSHLHRQTPQTKSPRRTERKTLAPRGGAPVLPFEGHVVAEARATAGSKTVVKGLTAPAEIAGDSVATAMAGAADDAEAGETGGDNRRVQISRICSRSPSARLVASRTGRPIWIGGGRRPSCPPLRGTGRYLGKLAYVLDKVDQRFRRGGWLVRPAPSDDGGRLNGPTPPDRHLNQFDVVGGRRPPEVAESNNLEDLLHRPSPPRTLARIPLSADMSRDPGGGPPSSLLATMGGDGGEPHRSGDPPHAKTLVRGAMDDLVQKGAAAELSSLPLFAITTPTFVIEQKSGNIRQIAGTTRWTAGKMWIMNALMFRLSGAPGCFPRVVKEPAKIMRFNGHSVVLWIDDMTWTGATDEEFLTAMHFGTRLLQVLGILLKWEKAELSPTPIGCSIGWTWDLPAAKIFLTEEKVHALPILIRVAMCRNTIHVRMAARLFGTLQSIVPAIALARLYLRHFERALSEVVGRFGTPSYRTNRHVPIAQLARSNLRSLSRHLC
ncbi:hypothetical protein BDK51DRAFT_32638 [Blyttiomyces helicus]|uniref:Reverse transcriptase domain-containing protein n=1 Tax=Blyttiomyces helicus TaxID=388810 RepID=A0A4P9WJQ2_9FUNG|nr:hypothetical protein BDK51DRAFT_32638 [Blyttiomyces helicus]|eukprot:RKO91370.1 hypothetical protein BDK51DRAFT_32638 [Blyttiomyces helicus]